MNKADLISVQLGMSHLAAFDEAETLMFHSDFCPYFELKEMLSSGTPLARRRFEILFTSYYRLNVGGLTDDFKRQYFRLLFEAAKQATRPDFSSIVLELAAFPNRKGHRSLQFSFVSKLVAMHDELSPIYDRHVRAFFAPAFPSNTDHDFARTEIMRQFLAHVERQYCMWATDARVTIILDRLKERDARLRDCHPVRLLDFLVWKVGNQKLLPE